MTEILETFPQVFCFPKSRIYENAGTHCVCDAGAVLYQLSYRANRGLVSLEVGEECMNDHISELRERYEDSHSKRRYEVIG